MIAPPPIEETLRSRISSDYAKYADQLVEYLKMAEPTFNEEDVYEEAYIKTGRIEPRVLSLRASIMLNRLKFFDLNKCQVRPSPIHGFGVFATQNIKKDELITLYPGDALFVAPHSLRKQRMRQPFAGPKGYCDERKIYSMGVDDLYAISGDPNDK